MSAALAHRKPAATHAPLGSGDLHAALAAADASARLASFARTVGCDPLDLSADQGKSLDILRIISVMRGRGYTIADPVRPQQQLARGMTTWLLAISFGGCSATLGFHLPLAPK